MLCRNGPAASLWHSVFERVSLPGAARVTLGMLARALQAGSVVYRRALQCLPYWALALAAGLPGGLPAQSNCPWCGPDSVVPLSIEGVVDVHVHSAPDSGPRSIGAVDLARLARAAGMRALLLKNHFAPTAGLAYAVEQAEPGIRVLGGIALNASSGLNPIAVGHMARTTGGHGRVVWMPTFDSEHYHRVLAPNPDHVPVSSDGRLLPATLAVLAVIAEHRLALATGHSSPEESLLIIRKARQMGIDRILVTHPLPPPVSMSIALQKEAAEMGALLEYPVGTALASNPQWQGSAEEKFRQYVHAIREVGPAHVVISSDLGQSMNPLHTDGLAVFLAQLLAAGFSKEEIDLMARENPARWLALE